MFQLRPYQAEAKRAILSAWDEGQQKTLLVLPTGCGKTVVFSSVTETQVDKGHRVLIMAHRGELLEQAADKLQQASGIQSVLEKAESSCLGSSVPVTVGSVQSLAHPARLARFPGDYYQDIIVDEAHHCLSESYRRVLDHFPEANVLGVTATPDRGDKRDLGEYFDSLAYEYSMTSAIKEGYLCPIRAQMIPLKLDISSVGISNGDFAVNEIGHALEPYLMQIAKEMAEYCQGRKTVARLPLISTSQKFCAMLNDAGLIAAEINGYSEDRAEILADFEAGKYDVLCNSMLLTEGWEGVTDELPDMQPLSDFKDDPPPLPEELIAGILRRGHKMLISGSSKAGKSFLLMELCIAIAEGRPWLGFACRKGRVLYVNLEIDPASAVNRFFKIYEALGIKPLNADSIVLWNLRGHAVPLDQLVPKLIRRVRDQRFDAIIIDPIYKVITGDENNASEMGAFCNQFDKICTETGCSTIYCHHHSKGSQGMKRAMDRASGSGVFARDPDAQLDMIQLELSDDIKNNVRDGNATAWRLESSLREFPNIQPVNFWFEYPVHRVDSGDLLGGMPAQGSPQAAKVNNPRSKSSCEAADEFRTAFDALNMDGIVKIADLAEHLGVADKTVYARIKKMEGEFLLEKGAVRRA